MPSIRFSAVLLHCLFCCIGHGWLLFSMGMARLWVPMMLSRVCWYIVDDLQYVVQFTWQWCLMLWLIGITCNVQGFILWCLCFRSGSTALQQLPAQWLKEVLEEVKCSDPSSKLCATRRSAGIPFYIQVKLTFCCLPVNNEISADLCST